MKRDCIRHSSVPKQPSSSLVTQSLLDQSDLFVRRLHLENIQSVTLDRSITDRQAALSDRKVHLRPLFTGKFTAKQLTLVATLTNELHYARTQLAQMTVEREQLQSEIDTVRREMARDKAYIARTEEAITDVHSTVCALTDQRKRTEKQQARYQLEMQRVGSVDRTVDLTAAGGRSPVSKRLRKPNHSVSLPKESFEPPRTDLLRALVAKWRSKAESQRTAVTQYKQYVTDLTAGFAVVNGSSPSVTAEEVTAWMHKEQVLRTQLNLIEDEVAALGQTIGKTTVEIQRLTLARSPGDVSETGGVLPCTAPLLSALLRQTDLSSHRFRNSQDFELLRSTVVGHTEELKRLGKIYEIQTADKHDHLKALWEPLVDLKSAFATAGFDLRTPWDDTGFSLESLTELSFRLESSLRQFVEFLQVGGLLGKHVQPGLSPKGGTHWECCVPAVHESVDVHHPMTRGEFWRRAGEKVGSLHSE